MDLRNIMCNEPASHIVPTKYNANTNKPRYTQISRLPPLKCDSIQRPVVVPVDQGKNLFSPQSPQYHGQLMSPAPSHGSSISTSVVDTTETQIIQHRRSSTSSEASSSTASSSGRYTPYPTQTSRPSSPSMTVAMQRSISEASVMPGGKVKRPVSLKRQMQHLRSEQKRRENLKNGFDQLKQAVPCTRESQDPKATILMKAVDYISALEAELLKAQGRVSQLEHQTGGSWYT
ncbi:hypothetical protein G7K_2657-t1 [Saitoella complicata NRRL Y-17804]|uniref:BHLH domain-containing protein n=1 Tax=Saitoella complicata (strain BCRC 22490 / CBS 7301 / JCM 7358 / NBRC 10748 / NRRL Y-17804) TaxID=698492 RepID=A0A0E9NF70_SAICN|nr:hypothetical protein G7K_2657-t1 [Saitoella complicata NRRL Y-17804]